MECKIVILSDKILSGDLKFDMSVVCKNLMEYGLEIKSIEITNQNKKFDDFSSPTFLFLHDENIDDFLSKNKFFYDEKSEIIDNMGILAGINFPVLVLPIESDINSMMKKAIQKIAERYNLMKYSMFRLFGITRDQIEEKIKEVQITSKYIISGNGLFNDIYLKRETKPEYISQDEVTINQLFEEYTYSQNDMNIALVAINMLKILRLKIGIDDSFTHGKIAKELLDNGIEGMVSSTFNYSQENGFVKSLDSVYRDENEMVNKRAYNYLEKGFDISVAIAGRKVGNYYKIYVAIGDEDMIEMFNLSIEGNLKDAVEIAINSTLFNLIKKLRKKDFANLLK